MREVCASWARRERAMNTLQQLFARRINVMDAIRTMGTSCGRCVHAITDKFDIFRRISRRRHSTLTSFQNAVQRLWHRRLVCLGLYLLFYQTIPNTKTTDQKSEKSEVRAPFVKPKNSILRPVLHCMRLMRCESIFSNWN